MDGHKTKIEIASEIITELVEFGEWQKRDSYRGQGYGKQMMQQALEISADAGCYKVTLSSNIKRDAFMRSGIL